MDVFASDSNTKVKGGCYITIYGYIYMPGSLVQAAREWRPSASWVINNEELRHLAYINGPYESMGLIIIIIAAVIPNNNK